MLEEIRLHGRGGQGVVVCAELMALAALYDGKMARSFPWFGIARRGAPTTAFVVMGDPSEFYRCMVYNPKYVVVLDPQLHVVSPEVTSGIKENSVYVQNSTKEPRELLGELGPRVKLRVVATVDATGLALEYMGTPIPNIAMLGAFVKATGLVSLSSAERAVKARFPEKLWDKYVECLKASYEKTRVEVLSK